MSPFSSRPGARGPNARAQGADHRVLSALVLALTLLTSCGPGSYVKATATPLTPTRAAGVTTIRFALVGDVTKANVWALFDSPGYSYNNYAVRQSYWPRLFDLSIPDGQFEAAAAAAMPAPVRQEGAFYTATVPLRTDLNWSDGSPFTAEDVAFTVNAALKFNLGFDWQSYYDPTWLDHVEAVEPHTVKYFFRRMPNVGVWQYGALQGPAVQRDFWAARISDAAALLPGNEAVQQIQSLQDRIADLQARVTALNLATYTAIGDAARQAQADLRRQQGNLSEAINDLDQVRGEYDGALSAARAALYALDDAGEPHLGAWQPRAAQAASGAAFENEFNPAMRGSTSRFLRADYYTYATAEAALRALNSGAVDAVLDPTMQAPGDAASAVMTSPSRHLRFLAFNLSSDELKDPALRQALACILDQEALAGQLGGAALPLEAFVQPASLVWYNPDAGLPCHGLDASARLAQAISILKGAGYTWTQEPTAEHAGQGLAAAKGRPPNTLELLAPSSDKLRGAAAAYIQDQARLLGIPLRTRSATEDAINFAVFSSHQYDMALLGWTVSPYPAYLCEWFAVGGPFHYEPSQLTSACGALAATNDLDEARGQIAQIQSALAAEVPMIPLFSVAAVDAYRNISYPFTHILDGLSGVYGAPELASLAAR